MSESVSQKASEVNAFKCKVSILDGVLSVLMVGNSILRLREHITIKLNLRLCIRQAQIFS